MVETTRAIVVGALLLAAAEAHAGVNAATCTPGDPAIQSDRYFITAGSVNYRSGRAGW